MYVREYITNKIERNEKEEEKEVVGAAASTKIKKNKIIWALYVQMHGPCICYDYIIFFAPSLLLLLSLVCFVLWRFAGCLVAVAFFSFFWKVFAALFRNHFILLCVYLVFLLDAHRHTLLNFYDLNFAVLTIPLSPPIVVLPYAIQKILSNKYSFLLFVRNKNDKMLLSTLLCCAFLYLCCYALYVSMNSILNRTPNSFFPSSSFPLPFLYRLPTSSFVFLCCFIYECYAMEMNVQLFTLFAVLLNSG